MRDQHTQVVINACVIACVGKAVGLGQSLHFGLMCLFLFQQALATIESIADFLKSGLDCLLVVGDVSIAFNLRGFIVSLPFAPIEDRQSDLRSEFPGARTAFEQVSQRATGYTRARRQLDGGKIRSSGCRQIGIRGFQVAFSLENIRPAQQNIRRYASRNILECLI